MRLEEALAVACRHDWLRRRELVGMESPGLDVRLPYRHGEYDCDDQGYVGYGCEAQGSRFVNVLGDSTMMLLVANGGWWGFAHSHQHVTGNLGSPPVRLTHSVRRTESEPLLLLLHFHDTSPTLDKNYTVGTDKSPTTPHSQEITSATAIMADTVRHALPHVRVEIHCSSVAHLLVPHPSPWPP